MNRVRDLLARVQSVGPVGFDRALAAVFLAGAALEVASIRATPGQRLVVAVLELATAALVLWRRRIPAAGLTVFAASLVIESEMSEKLANGVTVPFVSLFVLAYSLGAYAERRQMLAGAIVAAIGMTYQIASTSATWGDAIGGIFFASVFLGAPLLVGRTMRNRRLLAAALAEKNEVLEREQELRARRAVEEERDRIARELHDVVAHSISLMTVQAEAVSRVATRMPEQARTSLQTIEDTGREALTEMRRLLGVLRRGDESMELAPQPSLGQVRLLVDRARAAGLQVELRIEGEARHLSAGVDLAAYRVVQEALTDALARAGARNVTVSVRYGERNVRLEVSDDGSAFREGGDTGELSGMRERVALYGGDLEVGPAAGEGYAVRARLPLDLVRA
jgi:signal transduction histidine kinase